MANGSFGESDFDMCSIEYSSKVPQSSSGVDSEIRTFQGQKNTIDNKSWGNINKYKWFNELRHNGV